MNRLYSHYSTKNKKELKTHLQNVADNSKGIINSKDLDLTLITKKDLSQISYLIAVSHDFGKSSTYFQNYLIHGEESYYSHHGLISSVFAYLLIEKIYNKRMATVAYMVVKKHHGNLESPISVSDGTFNDTRKQIRNIKEKNSNKIIKIYNELLKDFNCDSYQLLDDLEEFLMNTISLSEYFRDILDLNFYDKNKQKSDKGIELFLITNFLYSALIDSDKKDAAGINNDYFEDAGKEIIDVEKYLNYLRKEKPKKFNPEKRINKERNNFLKEVIKNPELKSNNYLYNLTAPTGIGKTFASFAFANKLRKMSTRDKKIIYCLPFTSIIDQNYDEFEKLVKFNLGEKYNKNPTKYLLRHHYLTPMIMEKNIDGKDDSKKSKDLKNYLDEKLLLKSWESGNIVTTFVQLLESIIGNKNSYLIKFHNMINSIIILDEVQNIPVKYYDIVGRVLKILATRFKTHILLMTATQPEIISGNEVINLTNTSYGNKEIFDRVDLNIVKNLKPQNIEQFIKYFEESFNKKSGLIVCNTVSSAIKIYDEINKIFDDYKIYSLTTNLTPKDRKEKINEINSRINNGEKIIVISTQLIEAGVDMSFEMVYRDFGPLDSIVQVAGRCNRSGEFENKGKMNIFKLKNEEGTNYCERIYDKKLLDICENIIDENKSFLELSKKYFSEIKNSYERASYKILKAMFSLNYNIEKKAEIPIKDFKLIEYQKGKEDIIICQNNKVEDKINRLKKIYGAIKNTENREEINKLIAEKELINKELSNYKISVYRNYLDDYYDDYKIIKEFRFIKYVSYEDQKEYLYDEDIGFLKEAKKKNNSSEFF